MVGGIFIWPTGGPSYRSHPPNAYGLDFRGYPHPYGHPFFGYRVPLIFWATSDEAHLALLGTFMALSRKHSNFRHSRGRRW
jgi:hypothetical protein